VLQRLHWLRLERTRLYEVIRDVTHRLYVARRSLLTGYVTVSRITHKCNSVYVHKKSGPFPMEIFMDLTIAEWHFWLINKIGFQPDRLSSIWTLWLEIRLRHSLRYGFQLADFHENNACLTSSFVKEILSQISRKIRQNVQSLTSDCRPTDRPTFSPQSAYFLTS
jgi:hypothetical protein